MSLESATEKIIEDVLAVKENEEVLLLTDGVDDEVIEAFKKAIRSKATLNYAEYEEPEHHGEEPPERVARKLAYSDVFIAATNKSISHTEARNNATENGARGASMPMITKEVLETSADVDYGKMEEITEKAYDLMKESEKVRITTPLGTDLELKIEEKLLHPEGGLLREPGDFGNIPSGEVYGPGIKATGIMVVDHLPMDPSAEGVELVIQDNEVVEVRGGEDTELKRVIEEVDGARNIAELGFGTNPAAELTGNLTNDEKILGTVHVALGDNQSFLPEDDDRRVQSDIHWDIVHRSPDVWFGETKILDAGEPEFL